MFEVNGYEKWYLPGNCLHSSVEFMDFVQA